MSNTAIGIDFGTTKTLVAHLHPGTGRPETLRLGRGADYIPTTVCVSSDGDFFFGDDAEDMIEYPDVSYLRGFKMQLGSEAPLHMCALPDGSLRFIKAHELVTEFLRHLRLEIQEKVYWGEEVNAAVITRPVNFSPARCAALEEAAREAGFKRVSLTTEPEAAGLAFCRLNAAAAFKGNALVVDWGGGTLDFALVSRRGDEIISHAELTDGNVSMGGEQFDERLWHYVAGELSGRQLNPVTQLPRIRKAKEQLSLSRSVTLRLSSSEGHCPPLTLTRDAFNELIARDVDMAVEQVLRLLNHVPEDMAPEMLLLVGGSSAIPLIKKKLEAASGLPAHNWQYSREAVALGAALWQTQDHGRVGRFRRCGGGDTPEGTDNEHVRVGAGLGHSIPLTPRPAGLRRPSAPDHATGHVVAVAPRPRIGRSGCELGAKVDAPAAPALRDAVPSGCTTEPAAPQALSAPQAREELQRLGIGKKEYGEALLEAASTNDAVRLGLLTAARADVNVRDTNGNTPLMRAAAAAGLRCLEALLRAGAEVNARGLYGLSAAHQAALSGSASCLSALLGAGADFRACDQDGRTPLHAALEWGSPACAKLLLEEGADVSARDANGKTALHMAAASGNAEGIASLIAAGADVQAADAGGNSPLHAAAAEGRREALSALLDAGSVRDDANDAGATPLHAAAARGQADCSALLLDRGAAVSARDVCGNTPLHLAVESGDSETVRLLLDRGAEVNAANDEGATPLHFALSNGDAACVACLLEAGADANATDFGGHFPLLSAVEQGDEESVRALLQKGARANFISAFIDTPLQAASRRGDRSVIDMLQAAGARE